MKTIDKDILKDAESFVSNYYRDHTSENLIFHTFNHTLYVVEGVRIIGKNSGISPEDILIAEFSAWFHDIGYIESPESHEEHGIEMALEFLNRYQIDSEVKSKVKEAILSTKIDHKPTDIISKLLCDADLRHLAAPDYFDRVNLLRKEIQTMHGEKLKKSAFDVINLEFMKTHYFYTSYGKDVLENGKLLNQKILEKKMEKKAENKSQLLQKKKSYSRGVESMFRTTARNQINLSSIADNKSNILISVNTIIISIILTFLVSQMYDNPALIIPTTILLLFSLVTIIFAILSTRPNISSGKFTKEDIKQNKVNLLFFGNFYNMELKDYEWAIQELMKNDEDLYGTMIKDQFNLGKVLAKKYKLLRISYNIFMIGLIVSIAAFIAAFVGL